MNFEHWCLNSKRLIGTCEVNFPSRKKFPSLENFHPFISLNRNSDRIRFFILQTFKIKKDNSEKLDLLKRSKNEVYFNYFWGTLLTSLIEFSLYEVQSLFFFYFYYLKGQSKLSEKTFSLSIVSSSFYLLTMINIYFRSKKLKIFEKISFSFSNIKFLMKLVNTFIKIFEINKEI